MILCLIAFIVYATIALLFDKVGTFDQEDIVFQSDISTRVANLAHGWSGTQWTHPNLAILFSVPLRLLTITMPDAESVRRSIALFISPVCASLSVFLLHRTLMRVAPFGAAAITLLFAGSFTGLIFGAVPESYGPSLLIITATLYVLARSDEVRHRRLYFIGLMFLAGSMTITNLAIVGLGCLIAEYQHGPLRAVVRTAGVGSAGLLLIAAVAVSFSLLRGDSVEMWRGIPGGFAKWLVPNVAERAFIQMPSGFANSIVPIDLEEIDSPIGQPIDLEFTLDAPSEPNYVGIVGLVLVAWGSVVAMWRGNSQLRRVGLWAYGIIAFNWLLHSFWGDEVFLYSAHWLPALAVLIALAVSRTAAHSWVTPLLWVGAIVVSLVNIYTVMGMVRMIGAA